MARLPGAAAPQAIDLGLTRLQRVLERLQWRQPALPVIMVAGTNGKGSVTAYCTAMLSAAGYRVGTFTSPHLRDYRERIKIHDRLVSADELVAAFEKIEAARGDTGLTFFEFNALGAFLVFEAAALDVWILEVGMGGRLDAVNVVDPDVAVVVSIGLDHQEFLGTTLEAIACEKAGIFRAGRVAVIGSLDASSVLEEAALAVGATLKRFGTEYGFVKEGSTWRYSGTRWDMPRLPAPALLGDVQYANAATAMAALEALDEKIELDFAAVAEGLESVQLAGRFQLIAAKPSWILDVAHNPDAARGAGAQPAQNFGSRENLCSVRHVGRQGCASGGGDTERLLRCVVVLLVGRCARSERRALGRCHSDAGRYAGGRRRQRGVGLQCGAVRGESCGSHCCVRVLSHRGSGTRVVGSGGNCVMERRVKERLLGASILVALIVLIVPELLSGPKPAAPVVPRLTLSTSAPQAVRNVTVDLATSKAPQTTEAHAPPATVAPAVTAEIPAAAVSTSLQPAAPAEWAVQLGSFASQVNSDKLLQQLKAQGFPVYALSAGSGRALRIRVRIGPLPDRSAAERTVTKLKSLGHDSSVVTPGH